MDNVNHPAHYEGQTSIECIEAMQIAFGKRAVADFCLCNAFKYLWRHKNKNGQEDLRKAQWYLDKADELIYMDVNSYGSMPEQISYMEGMVAKYMGEEEE